MMLKRINTDEVNHLDESQMAEIIAGAWYTCLLFIFEDAEYCGADIEGDGALWHEITRALGGGTI